MKKQIDYILLGTLWLLAATLGISFWFNTQFGFNIFSGAHWQYLGQLQASDTHVRPMFYISMVLAVIVTIAGLYLLMQPRLRRMRMPGFIRRIGNRRRNIDNIDDAAQIVLPPAQTPAPTPTPIDNTPRPPRLNIARVGTPGATQNAPTGAAASAMTTPAPTMGMAPHGPVPQTTINFDDIKQIFESAGYTVKPSPRIAGIRPALFAIGADETLWMGSVGIEPGRLNAAMERLNSVFTDTLEDIVIRINGFVIDARGPVPDGANIHVFDSLDAVRTYMDAHRNRTMTDAERDDFGAYSEYIDTVSNYLNKV
ncbi:MAG: hypothetical protein K2L95_00715 [Alphaproteobacteria bacterium]|nr:hypothetical protein [Alphaproteobacteria bacterium]